MCAEYTIGHAGCAEPTISGTQAVLDLRLNNMRVTRPVAPVTDLSDLTIKLFPNAISMIAEPEVPPGPVAISLYYRSARQVDSHTPKVMGIGALRHRVRAAAKTSEPETLEPEILEPETLQPENPEPETLEPKSLGPETLEPETLQPETPEAETLGRCWKVISPKVFIKSFCISQFSHKSVNLFFILVMIKEVLADLCWNRLWQNGCINTFCEIKTL